MANLLHATRFQSPSTAVNPITVTIPATTPGAMLVCIAGGGATIQAKLGGIGGTNFTKRTSSLNNREVVAQDIVDSGGGTTTISISLNGAENIDGILFEFAPGSLGGFIAGANEGGTGGNNSIDHNTWRAYTGQITTAGPAVVFTMFTAGEVTDTPVPERQFWGVEPVGKTYWNGFNDPDTSKSAYWSLIAVSDQASAGTFQGRSSRAVPDSEHQSGIWAYTDNQPATPTYTDPYPNYIARENSRPGDSMMTWSGGTTSNGIAGYTNAMSYAPGDTVSFKVDSLSQPFTVEMSRLGYYGYFSFGGRVVDLVVGSPAVQPAPTIDAYGGTVCNWTTTASWTIPADTPPGIYVYNMRRADDPSKLAAGLFVVRNTIPTSRDTSRLMLVTADYTWQAHNTWGATSDSGNGYAGYTGRSLSGQAPNMFANNRAYAVSYDRPWGTPGNNPYVYFWDSESALVNFLEGNGYPVDYYCMSDLEKDPTIPSKYGVAVVSGNSEYWSTAVHDAFATARDSGTNLVFCSSNTAFWKVRFDPADTNKRRLICYQDSLDQTGWDATTKYDPIEYTGTWRDIRAIPGGVNNTTRRPESGITGLWFVGNGEYDDALAIARTYRNVPIWRNTSFANDVNISFGGTSSTTLSTPDTQINLNQPSSTAVGDLMVVTLTFPSSPGTFAADQTRVLRISDDGVHPATIVLTYYASGSGAQPMRWSWVNTIGASCIIANYKNAVLSDSNSSSHLDTGSSAAHITDTVAPGGNDRWAICIFADADATGSSKTTSWTAGPGLTLRGQVNNAVTGGPWNSIAVMDSNGAVTQANHQYSATAQFANPNSFSCILYLTPGHTANNTFTVGYEWDYLKIEEPSTPTNLVRLSDQVLTLQSQGVDYNGATYIHNATHHYGPILYQASSGALVFSTGSWRYAFGLSRIRKGLIEDTKPVDINLQQSMLNILCDMGINPTIILNTVANNDPTALINPLPAALPAAYGLPVTPPVYQTIFDTSTPGITDNRPSGDLTLGTVFMASSDGQIHGVRWYFPETLPNQQVIGLLYSWTSDATGTELARATALNPQTGWHNIMFGAPVGIKANVKYTAAIWTYDRAAFTSGGLTASIVNGPLTTPADVAVAHNGKAIIGVGGPALPTGSSGSTNYFVDVLYTGSGTVAAFEGWGFPLG